MKRRQSLSATIIAACLGLGAASNSLAADYKPVSCRAVVAYKGAPLHAPPMPLPQEAARRFGGDMPPATVERLEAAFKTAFQASRARAMSVAIGVPGQGLWTKQEGASQPLFYWASVGKQATATVVLQLAQEGRLSLSDPISRWVKGVPNGDAITLETLLNHTSGLFSANEDLQVHKENRPLDLETELAVLRRHGAMFCPGERWRYSNSGYDLLGQVIEQIDRRPLADAIAARITTPLGLTGMRALGRGSPIDDVAAPVSDRGEPALDVFAPGAAGPLVATAADMVRFEQAMLAGDLLTAPTRDLRIARLYPMFEPGMSYGLGVMLYDLPNGQRRLYWIGHSGGGPGVKALSIYAPDLNVFVAVALTGDGSAEATANLLLRAMGTPTE